MATPAGHLVQDQNLNIHSTGAFLRGKVDASKPTKKGGMVGGRRALNDISNSGKPSVVQPSTKIKPINVVPTGKDLGVSKANPSKNQEKGKATSGRKALSDLTNTVKPSSLQHLSAKSQAKKSSVIGGDNVSSCSIKEEAFLHNHEECLKAQRKTMSFDHFLETVGLGNGGSSLVLREPWELMKPESPVKQLEEMMTDDEEVDDNQTWKWEPKFPDSPLREAAYYHLWKDEDFLDLELVASPEPEVK